MTFDEIENTLTAAVAPLRAAHPSTTLHVTRTMSGLEIRSTKWAPVSVSHRATEEQVQAAIQSVQALCAKLSAPRPAVAVVAPAPRARAARRYDALYNEGGEGFNPYR